MNCKKNIQPLPDVLGLKFINALQPVTFNWTTEPVGTPHYGDTHIGLIAEDVCTAIANTGSELTCRIVRDRIIFVSRI